MLGALLRCRAGLANRCAEVIKFALRIVQLATDNLQTHDERVNVDTGCCRYSIWHFNGGLSQGSARTDPCRYVGTLVPQRCRLEHRAGRPDASLTPSRHQQTKRLSPQPSYPPDTTHGPP